MSSAVQLLDRALGFYELLIFVYVILSWFARGGGVLYEAYRALGSVCEPYIGLFRRIVPATGGLDFSPLVALLVLEYVIRGLLVGQVLGALL